MHFKHNAPQIEYSEIFTHQDALWDKREALRNILSVRHCIFKAEWRSHPDFSDWIKDVKDQPQQAYCTLCRKSFDVANMGTAALRSHSKGQIHIKAKSCMVNLAN